MGSLRLPGRLAHPALKAVLVVGELDARVADGAAAVKVQRARGGADAGRDDDRLAKQQALVAVDVADELSRWVLGLLAGARTQ